jgi:polyisoprenoid-binding protein YceI
MPTDEGKLSELPDRFVAHLGGTGRVGPTDRVRFDPIGTWIVDPAESSLRFIWRKFRLWTITGRLHCLGVIHLDQLPPVGVIRFQQSSGLPVLTMALDPASVGANGGDLNAMLGGPDVVDVRRHRWWTLRSESLEILPGGGWRVMATLTANHTSGLVELHLEVDQEASSPDRLVLRGRGVLDRRAFGIGVRASMFNRQIRLELAVRARRVIAGIGTEGQEQEEVACTTSMSG